MTSVLQFNAEMFKKRGISDQDYLDAVITLVFWIYLSQEAGIRKAVWTQLPKSLYLNAGMEVKRDEEIIMQAESFKRFLDSQFEVDALFVSSASITNLNPGILSSLARSLYSFFSDQREWSDSFIGEIFLSIEDFFAERLETPYAYFTPHQVCKLISSFFQPSEQRNAYDPFCRDNSLLLSCFAGYGDRVSIMGNSDSQFNGKIARLKSVMSGFPNDKIMVKNLYDSDLSGWSFDLVLTNPPFGGKSDPDLYFASVGNWSREFAGISSEVDYLAHVMDHMSGIGRAAVVVPVGLLSGQGKKRWLREKLVESNILEAIVYLPRWIFHKNGVLTAVLILDNNRLDREILLLNAAALGTHDRNRHTLSDRDFELLTNLYNIFRQKLTNGNAENNDIQIAITKEYIRQHEFDLQFQTFVSKQVDYATDRQKAIELWNDLTGLHKQLTECNEKLDRLFSKNPS